MTTNIEIQTAEQNIAKLKHRVTGPDGHTEKLPSANQTAALNALANEHEIIRLAKRIEQFLGILIRDYTSMAEMFCANGETCLYNMTNELPELKSQLRCRKEARTLYDDLLH